MNIDWTLVIVASISAVPPSTIAALAFSQAKAARKQIEITHTTFNSKMDTLFEVQKELGKVQSDLAYLKGRADEKATHGGSTV